MKVIDIKEKFPIICFGGKTFTKILVEMLFDSVTKILTTASVKPV
jgi:hypothetical protein